MINKVYKQQKGFALVAVIWVVGFLTMVLTVTLIFVKKEAETVTESEHSFRAWQLAHTGLSYGSHSDVKLNDDVLSFSSKDFDESYSVELRSEDAKININHVVVSEDKEFLRNLFKLWLDDLDKANQLTDAMVDWVDSNDLESLNGAEKDWYIAKGYQNRPFNREFLTLDEIRLVKGFTEVEERVPDWRSWFTVYSSGPIDIHEAEPKILSVAAETDLINAEQFFVGVRGIDELLGTDDDLRYTDLESALDALNSFSLDRFTVIERFTLQGSTTSIESTGRSGEYRTKISAVIRKQSRGANLLSYEETNLTSE